MPAEKGDGHWGELTEEGLDQWLPAEEAALPLPVPTQVVSSDEYLPSPQTPEQKQVQAKLIEIADSMGGKFGLSRRRFFKPPPAWLPHSWR
jgi:uncharacterized protein